MKKLLFIIGILVIIIAYISTIWFFTKKVDDLKYKVKYYEQTLNTYKGEVELRDQENVELRQYCNQIYWESYYHHTSDMCLTPYSEGFTLEEKETIRKCFEKEGLYEYYE